MKTRLLIIWCLLSLQGLAQAVHKTSGSRFWLAYMENLEYGSNEPNEFKIALFCKYPASGTISVPATGLEIPFSISSGTHTTVTLPQAYWYVIGSDVKGGKGILITADKDVDVVAFHFKNYFCDATKVIPEAELGTRYSIVAGYDSKHISPSSFVVLSTANNNQVEITPSAITMGLRAAGVPHTVTLDSGELYQVQSMDDLSGSFVRSLSNKNLAVFSGAKRAYTPACGTNGHADNHLYEQLLPDLMNGKKYDVLPVINNGTQLITVTVKEDNTSVQVTGNPAAVYNKGSFRFSRSGAFSIEADKEIAVAAFNRSQQCNNMLGDPTMMSIRPRNLPSKDEYFWSPGDGYIVGPYFREHYVDIITTTADTALVKIDGNGVHPFVMLDAAYSYAQVLVDSGFHHLESSAPFYGTAYGYNYNDGYCYSLGYFTNDSLPIDTFNRPKPQPPVGPSDGDSSGGLPGTTPGQLMPDAEFNVFCFPNPVLDNDLHVYFLCPDPGIYQATYEIFDMAGRAINNGIFDRVSLGDRSRMLNVSGLAPGGYCIRIFYGNKYFDRSFSRI